MNVDPILETRTHEAAHVVVGIFFNWRPRTITVDPFGAGGSVEWEHVPEVDDLDLHELVRQKVCIQYAGRMAAEGLTAMGDTFDELEAEELWRMIGSPPGFLLECRLEVYRLLRRPEIRRAIVAVCFALADAGGSLDGAEAARIIDAALAEADA